ncbi:5,10-methylenetetrahydrofolate reductase (ferredoxin) [Murinocardiopsis flavida]|uniref:Methylenetetrahydrofolate reductase n=1 Tax=Murinocardiopsis flavida TaxID=645275 RepID=A0A2P8DKT5_9ACTN|nr:methylenetetrahydrofolate reductase [Murinocardiopsis flavida]PSK97823.1 5,10-methylenetetrahydrofolate reductase (ferredoxin) [Murinocardiopsis flavida]
MGTLAELINDPSPARPIVTAELPVVDGGGLDAVRTRLARIAPYVDAVNATDNAAAHAHASNVAIAIALRQAGTEPILQLVCRDKNRLALQADIAGAALHGITTVCCLTGDDVTAGDEPEARRVFDMDAPQLIRTAATMANGRYLSGRAISPAPPLLIGAVENPAAPPFAYRVRRGLKKAAAGARFLQLQICYHPERLAAFTDLAARTGLTPKVALLPTVCLVKGARALRFMDANVPGISVPAGLIEQIETAPDPREAAYQLALEQARHALALPGVRGLHLADFRHDDSVARLCADLGLPMLRQVSDDPAVAV